jgi:hypothetical protein
MPRPQFASLLVIAFAACAANPATTPPGRTHEELLALFNEWREFQRPPLVDGVPDYSSDAMTVQHRALPRFMSRLAAFDTTGWPIPQQVDAHVVRAEMNGLDFDHRVLMPWANNPAFYVTVFASESDQPAREGPFAWGAVELWSYPMPLDARSVAEIDSGLRRIPALLARARVNLTGDGADLWTYGARSIRRQSGALAQFVQRLPDSLATLRSAAEHAKAATDSFATWIEARVPDKHGTSGIGEDNYTWYLHNVQLLPYSWRDEVALMERELARAHAFLALEERRNAGLPEAALVSSQDEHTRRFNAAVTEYMQFLSDRQVLTVKPYMDSTLRARIGRYAPPPREFFTEVDYRDPMVMRTHGYHWFDKGWMRFDAPANPIRSVPLLYNLFITRTEGHATAWEEMMLQAGMFDRRPRSRELIYILVAQRAARALGDLRMHSNEKTLEKAAEFTSANTPRGWLSLAGNLVRSEQHLYLQQPAYGTSYLIGKIEIERLIAHRRRQLGDAFSFKAFMDEFNAAGQIPISLIHWQLTGELPPHLAQRTRRNGLVAPVQDEPADGAVFGVFPRTMVIRWLPVDSAAHYAVEVDFMQCEGSAATCQDSVGTGSNMYMATRIRGTEHTFDFVGAQHGRWRVWAVGRNDSAGPKSPWREFRYTK